MPQSELALTKDRARDQHVRDVRAHDRDRQQRHDGKDREHPVALRRDQAVAPGCGLVWYEREFELLVEVRLRALQLSPERRQLRLRFSERRSRYAPSNHRHGIARMIGLQP